MPLFNSLLSGHIDRGASFLDFLQSGHPHEDTQVHNNHHDFLGVAGSTALAPAAHVEVPCTDHSDFLFGSLGSTSLPGSSKQSTALISMDKLVPKLSMMAGATVFYEAVKPQVILVGNHLWSNVLPKLDPFGDGKEEREPPTSWCKSVPRGLRCFLAADIFSGLVVLSSLFSPCDVPLKSWLLGGILLGFPVSEIVNRVAKKRPAFQWYRLIAKQLRDGSDVKNMKVEGLLLFDQFNLPIHKSETEERPENKHWFCSLKFDRVELITGYQVVTASRGDVGKDPVSWVLEGSFDGVDWIMIDERERVDMPRERGAPTAVFEDMAHLDDSTSAFRSSFLLEVAGNAAAFAWLVAGTSWVSLGTETCVDSAPFLWYPSYLIVVLIWSVLGTITIGLIVSAVAMIVLGVKSPS